MTRPPSTGAVDLTVTVVSWNARDELRACLTSLHAEGSDLRVEVHVVDNASTDGSADMVAREFPGVVLFRNAENVGFARANNRSWAEARGRYWLLLNSDTVVLPGALGTLVRFLDAHPDAGLVTPRLVDPDGEPRRSPDLLPGVTRALVEAFRIDKLLPPTFRGEMWYGSDRTSAVPVRIGWACGAALAARRTAVQVAGPLSERFFMYGEDLEWCWRIREDGWEVWLCPDATVVHLESVSAARRWDFEARQQVILRGIYTAVAMHRSRGYVRALLAAQLVALGVECVAARVRGRPPPSPTVVRAHVHALLRPAATGIP